MSVKTEHARLLATVADRGEGWARPVTRARWHRFRSGDFLSACNRVISLGAVSEEPGGKTCIICAERVGVAS